MKIKEFRERCTTIENASTRLLKAILKANLLKEFATDKTRLEKATKLMHEFLQVGLKRLNDDEVL